jgi:hypothetical protein
MRFLTAVIGLLTVGCASGGTPHAPPTTTGTTVITGGEAGLAGSFDIAMTTESGGVVYVLDAPMDRVWSALNVVHATLGIPTNTVDPRTRSIGNTNLNINRTFAGEPVSNMLSCGVTGGVAANNYRIQMSLLTTLTSAPGGGTRVRTLVNATGRDPFAANAPVQCASTFNFERRIARLVSEQLQVP